VLTRIEQTLALQTLYLVFGLALPSDEGLAAAAEMEGTSLSSSCCVLSRLLSLCLVCLRVVGSGYRDDGSAAAAIA
jgi:hypothetical protein